MKKLLQNVGLSVLMVFCMSSVATMPAYAANACVDASDRSVFTLFPTWYRYLDLNSNCEVTSFDVPGDIWKIGIAVVEIILRVAGMVATVYVVIAGFKYVLSRGNPQEAAKARQTIIDAVIGVGIASVATVLVAFLGRALTK